MGQNSQDQVVIILPDIHSQNILDLIQTVENNIKDNTLNMLLEHRSDIILPWNDVFSLKVQKSDLDDKSDSNVREMIYTNDIKKEKDDSC